MDRPARRRGPSCSTGGPSPTTSCIRRPKALGDSPAGVDPPWTAEDYAGRGRLALEPFPSGAACSTSGAAGAASLALVPPAASVVGRRRLAEMLAAFVAVCESAAVASAAVLGQWPEASARRCRRPTSRCVTTSPTTPVTWWLSWWSSPAGPARRVVVELAAVAPVDRPGARCGVSSGSSKRPSGPTAEDALDVLDRSRHRAGGRARSAGRPTRERARARWRWPDAGCACGRSRRRGGRRPGGPPEVPNEVWTFAWPGDGDGGRRGPVPYAAVSAGVGEQVLESSRRRRRSHDHRTGWDTSALEAGDHGAGLAGDQFAGGQVPGRSPARSTRRPARRPRGTGRPRPPRNGGCRGPAR